MMDGMGVFLILLPVVLIGIALPWLGGARHGLVFGVTVPKGFKDSVVGRSELQRYRRDTLMLAVAVTLAGALLLRKGGTTADVTTLLCIPAELVGGFALWQRSRRAMLPHAVRVPLERRAELTPTRTWSGVLGCLSALLPLVVEAGWLWRNMARVPETWARHWNMQGEANGWSTRSNGGVFGPLAMGMLVVVMMSVVGAFVGRAPGPMKRQRAKTLAPLAGLSWLIAGMFCYVGLLPVLPTVRPETVMKVAIGHVMATFAVVGWMLWRSGMTAEDEDTKGPRYDGTPDAMWRGGGLIYFNREDAAVLVPKRYGWGWTLNFARPAAWVYLGGTLTFVCLLWMLSSVMK